MSLERDEFAGRMCESLPTKEGESSFWRAGPHGLPVISGDLDADRQAIGYGIPSVLCHFTESSDTGGRTCPIS